MNECVYIEMSTGSLHIHMRWIFVCWCFGWNYKLSLWIGIFGYFSQSFFYSLFETFHLKANKKSCRFDSSQNSLKRRSTIRMKWTWFDKNTIIRLIPIRNDTLTLRPNVCDEWKHIECCIFTITKTSNNLLY